MANPSFPIDPPELPAPADAPATTEVPHEEVHAALADALGVSADDVTAADPNDAPLPKPFTEIMADRRAKLDGSKGVYMDPPVFTPPTGFAPIVGGIVGDQIVSVQASPSALASSNPNAEPQWSPKITYDESGVIDASHPAVQAIFAQAAAEQEQATLPGIDSGAASPGPGPFADRAAISQRLKRQLRTSVMPEIEGEGLDHLAQIVARIMTTHDAENARAAWNDLARLCDDVAAALR